MTTKRLLAILAFLAFAGIAFAQQCDSAYPKTPALDLSINSLVAVGADVRVQVIERMNAPTLDAYERMVEQACPSWRAPDGGRKNNLIVVIVSIKDRKTGIYFGSQWRALESQWPRVQSSLMAPRFREGDYAGGVSAGLLEIGHLIQDADVWKSGRPVVVQQAATAPTDFSGLWTVFLCIVLIGGGIFLVVIVIKELAQRRKAREEITGAQQSALIAQQEATDAILAGSGREDEQYRNAVKSYGQMGSGTGALDPKIKGLTAPQYRAIADRYREVIDQASQPKKTNPAPHLESILGSTPRRSRASAKSQPPPVVHNTNTVIHEHYDHGTMPIFIPTSPSVVYVPEPSSYTPPEHHSSPAPDPSPSYGGSSDWGSSSSSSDSGGSSDFGSSSSDFGGGGGSSDW